jgi:tetratricopeptide (TPR) repeat protein
MKTKLFVVLGVMLSVSAAEALAWTGGSTGICVDANGRNFPCSDAPSSSSGSGGGGSGYGSGVDWGMVQGAVNNMVNQWQQMQQQMAAQATQANETGNQYFADGDYETAMKYYEQALRSNPWDPVIRSNLKGARAQRARQLYDLGQQRFYDNNDLEGALQYYNQAMILDPNDEYRHSIETLQESLKINREYKRREDEFASAKSRVGDKLGEMAQKLNVQSAPEPESSLDFIREKESAFSKPSRSTPADLASAGSQTLNPGQLRYDAKQKGLVVRDVPLPEVKPEWDPLSIRTPGQIVLEALDAGKGPDKKGPSDLDTSILYLDRYLKTENPNNVKVREAVSYLEGMRARAGMVQKKQGLFDAGEHDADALMEPLSGKKAPVWPGPKNPQPGAAGPNPTDWRFQRDEAVKEALKQNKGDRKAAIAFLENKVKKDDAGADGSLSNALQYLQAYDSYQEFTVKQNDLQAGKK